MKSKIFFQKLDLFFKNKKNKLIVVFLFWFSFIFILIVLSRINIEIIIPGKITNGKDTFKIENRKTNNNLYSTSVLSFYKPNYLIAGFLELSSKNETRKIIDSKNDNNLIGSLDMSESINNSIIVAYLYANKIDPNIKIDYELDKIIIRKKLSNHQYNNLKIGDSFDLINNLEIKSLSFLKLKELFKGNLILKNSKTNKEFKYYYSEFMKYPVDYLFSFSYNIKKTSPKITISKSKAHGPSGGMMQTLYIYTTLLNINIKYSIAGTGTINLDNSVGAIGGIIQKTYTVKNKVDYFIIPKYNYDKNKEKIENILKNSKTKVIYLSNFDEVITLINNLK